MPEPKKAMLYEKLDGQKVRCELCGYGCEIVAGKFGLCRKFPINQEVGNLDKITTCCKVFDWISPIAENPFFAIKKCDAACR